MIVRCTECNQRFELQQIVLKEAALEYTGRRYLIRYYECPRCKINHLVMVDDEQSLETQQEYFKKVNRVRDIYASKGLPSRTLLRRMRDDWDSLQKQHRKMLFRFKRTFYQFSELKLDNYNEEIPVTGTYTG